jgi:hypothetical protein
MISFLITAVSALLKVSGILFFLYMVYDGTIGGQGSSAVFIGTGVLAMITVGGHFIDKFGRIV